MLIDLASRDIVVSSQGDVEVSFVVSEVKVDFPTIIEDEALPVPVVRLETVSSTWMVSKQYSNGDMSPASMLRYGSILIEETCS